MSKYTIALIIGLIIFLVVAIPGGIMIFSPDVPVDYHFKVAGITIGVVAGIAALTALGALLLKYAPRALQSYQSQGEYE